MGSRKTAVSPDYARDHSLLAAAGDPTLAFIQSRVLELEQRGLATRTFRRLDSERQFAVIGAILREAAENGVASVGVKQVASRAGVSVGSLYQYFGDRDRMVAFAVAVSTSFLADSLEYYRPMLSAMPLREALTAYLAGGVEWSEAFSDLVRLFARAAYQGEAELDTTMVEPIARVMLGVVREILRAAAARGEVRENVNVEAGARMIHLLTIAIGDSYLLPHLNSYYQLHDPEVPFQRRVDELVDFVVAAVGGEAAADASRETGRA